MLRLPFWIKCVLIVVRTLRSPVTHQGNGHCKKNNLLQLQSNPRLCKALFSFRACCKRNSKATGRSLLLATLNCNLCNVYLLHRFGPKRNAILSKKRARTFGRRCGQQRLPKRSWKLFRKVSLNERFFFERSFFLIPPIVCASRDQPID